MKMENKSLGHFFDIVLIEVLFCGVLAYEADLTDNFDFSFVID